MNILITTDAFPPVCGGSGWSSYYLARALKKRGHRVNVVQASLRKPGFQQREYEGVRIYQLGVDYAAVPLYKKFKSKGYLYPHLCQFLEDSLDKIPIDIIHTQHLLTAPPSIAVANKKGIPVVCTVRDYWPLCFHSTILIGSKICLECRLKNMFSCLWARFPMMVLFSPIIIPFMKANLKFKQQMINRADRLIAVSGWLKSKLTKIIPEGKIEVIPNLIDLDRVQEKAKLKPKTHISGPFLLFVGKLAVNKGAPILLQVMQRLKPEIPLLIAGDGPLRKPMEDIALRQKLNIRFLNWVSNDEALSLMGHCSCLIFPTLWEEPLSRVLLEALGCGAPIAALSSGGTPEIIKHNYNGLLAKGLDDFVFAIKAIISDKALSQKLSANALKSAKEKFDQRKIIDRIIKLYSKLIEGTGSKRAK